MKISAKKILSMVLAICIVILLVSLPALAHPNSGTLVDQVGYSLNIDFNYENDVVMDRG